MKRLLANILLPKVKRLVKSFLGAVTFYTILPLPRIWTLEFQRIARWATLMGLLIGGLLGLSDLTLEQIGLPVLTRSVLVISIGIVLTGGLHLDGAIDTADGLATSERQRRLQVMQDSVTGAFGVMAAVVVLLLKIAALSDLHAYRWLALMLAASWGRWGQVMAIALYPYLKPTGKGAFHKQFIRLPQDLLWGLLPLLGLSGLQVFLNPARWGMAIATTLIGCAIALLTGFWFYRQLGGQTGDTYGAIVEWTEALFLSLLTIFLSE